MTDITDNSGTPDTIDAEALRFKYTQERQKRIRPDGERQYRYADSAEFEHYGADPYVEPGFSRDALVEDVDAVIVGGGFAGQLAAVRLQQAGISNFRIVEKAGDFGGTWYWNRYPGVGCDVESYIYMPLLEEVGYMPTEKYAKGAEILEYSKILGRHFGLYSLACFQTQVVDARWNEDAGRWFVQTDRGDMFRARFLIVNSGPLSRPKLPGIPGITSFKGHSFHTSRWDYAYTGGSPSDPVLAKLRDKKIGVIGTGATGVQCIPPLAQSSEHLYVFQRTPSAVGPRNNRPTDPEWASSLEPGWQERRMANWEKLIFGIPQDEDLVNDGWTKIWNKLLVAATQSGDGSGSEVDIATIRQMADFEHMEEIRRGIDAKISDPKTAETLKPYYNMFCKRPCFHDSYIDTFNRPNVTLIDTSTGIDRITEDAVIVGDQKYAVDCLVFATGFDAFTPIYHAAGFDPVGRGGISLAEKWSQGRRTLHGIMSNGFPNLLMVGAVKQAAGTVNFLMMMNAQCRHIAAMIKYCTEHHVKSLEPTRKAEDNWVTIIRDGAVIMQEFADQCTPGIYNAESSGAKESLWGSIYPEGPFGYMDLIEKWREASLFEEMALTVESANGDMSEVRQAYTP